MRKRGRRRRRRRRKELVVFVFRDARDSFNSIQKKIYFNLI